MTNVKYITIGAIASILAFGVLAIPDIASTAFAQSTEEGGAAAGGGPTDGGVVGGGMTGGNATGGNATGGNATGGNATTGAGAGELRCGGPMLPRRADASPRAAAAMQGGDRGFASAPAPSSVCPRMAVGGWNRG